MSSLAKRILFRLSKAPYGQSYAREALDAILAAAAFDQDVSLLFCGDGVYQLIKNQHPEQIQQKDFAAAFGLLPVYGVEHIYVAEAALRERNLQTEELALPASVLGREAVTALLHQQDQIVSF